MPARVRPVCGAASDNAEPSTILEGLNSRVNSAHEDQLFQYAVLTTPLPDINDPHSNPLPFINPAPHTSPVGKTSEAHEAQDH